MSIQDSSADTSTVSLPVIVDSPVLPANEDRSNMSIGSSLANGNDGEPAAPVASKGIILVVDDSSMCRKMFGNMVTQLGYIVDEADDGNFLTQG